MSRNMASQQRSAADVDRDASVERRGNVRQRLNHRDLNQIALCRAHRLVTCFDLGADRGHLLAELNETLGVSHCHVAILPQISPRIGPIRSLRLSNLAISIRLSKFQQQSCFGGVADFTHFSEGIPLMGNFTQRLAAARTVLRARATGNAFVIDDAEEAVSGYLGDDLEDYLAACFPNGLNPIEPLHLPEGLVEEFRHTLSYNLAHVMSAGEARLALEEAVRIVHAHQQKVVRR